jgi:DNA-binding transcriptional MerR regulator
MTIDELAEVAGTTSRTIRSLQTLGLVDPPRLRGRTGLYDAHHLERVRAILRLQARRFSLQSLAVLFDAHDRGWSLGAVLGLADAGPGQWGGEADGADADMAELYGFSDLQASGHALRASGRSRPLLAVVPTTVWDRSEAS